MHKEIIKRTLRVAVDQSSAGDAFRVATRLDSVLLKSNFKLSPQLFDAVAKLDPAAAEHLANQIIDSVKELLGDHVRHNTYFKHFPKGIPDTLEFWTRCIIDALGRPESAAIVRLQLSCGYVNLLDLPKYGRYLHSYEDMAAVHDAFVGCTNKKVKVLQLGGTYAEELRRLYDSLAGSTIPLSEVDRGLLAELAKIHVDEDAPASITLRENRAIVNAVKLAYDRPLSVDTLTDILRLAAHLAGGDVTLAEPTKFRSMPRAYRRRILFAIHCLAKEDPGKLSDIKVYREPWKRLFERLHPWEYREYTEAMVAHEVAMGKSKAPSLASRIEGRLSSGDISGAIDLYKVAPGMLFRSLNRLLCLPTGDHTRDYVIEAVAETASRVPARILFGVREYLQNRLDPSGLPRIFTNTKGKSWTMEDTRETLDSLTFKRLIGVIDAELASRLPEQPVVVVDPVICGLAIPLSDKGAESGFGIVPRGSAISICKNGEHLRFFCYWKEREQTTDFDLSVMFLDANFVTVGWGSYTSLRGEGYRHSGDITSAPNGASEFIDIDLSTVNACYVVPQVNVYSGEGFSEVEECFFGFMERNPKDAGLPYEPSTVRFKSGLRGVGKVALPLVFVKQEDNSWKALWIQMYLKGRPNFNRIETNRISAGLLAGSVARRHYLSFNYVIELMMSKSSDVLFHSEGEFATKEPVTYIGLSVPDGLPEGSTVYTLTNLHEFMGLFTPAQMNM